MVLLNNFLTVTYSIIALRLHLSMRKGAIIIKRLYFYNVTFLCFMDKLAQFLKKYRNEVIVGVLVLLFLIFRDVMKSFL